MMYYKISFGTNPKQLKFKTLRYFETVRDITDIVRRNFGIFRRAITVYDKNDTLLNEEDPVTDGNTYTVKCEPPKRRIVIL